MGYSLTITQDVWEDDIKMDLRDIGWDDMEWIHMNQAGDR
jgi:hypothetical protein